jgi:hypothetical protein
MICTVVEPIIFVLFAGAMAVVRFGFPPFMRQSAVAAILTGMGCSILLEMVNERWFAGQGTVYSGTLVPLWPFRFPVAIVCLTGLFALCIGYAVYRLTRRLPVRRRSPLFWALFLVTVAALNLSSLPLEHAGVALGYWGHLRANDLSAIYPYVYLFYLAVSLPAAAAFILGGHEEGSA